MNNTNTILIHFNISITVNENIKQCSTTRQDEEEEEEEGTCTSLNTPGPALAYPADTCGDVTASVRGANTGPQPQPQPADTCGDITASRSADTCGDRTASGRGASGQAAAPPKPDDKRNTMHNCQQLFNY